MEHLEFDSIHCEYRKKSQPIEILQLIGESQLRGQIIQSAIDYEQHMWHLFVIEANGGHIALYEIDENDKRTKFIRLFPAIIKGSYPKALDVYKDEIFVLYRSFCGIFTKSGKLSRVFKFDTRRIGISISLNTSTNEVFILCNNGTIQVYNLHGVFLRLIPAITFKDLTTQENRTFLFHSIHGDYCTGSLKGTIAKLDETRCFLQPILHSLNSIKDTIVLPSGNMFSIGGLYERGFIPHNTNGTSFSTQHNHLALITIHHLSDEFLIAIDNNAKLHFLKIVAI